MTDPISTDDAPNEIIAAAREQAAARRAAEDFPIGKVAIGVGIGSAAIVAALMFANRARKN